MTAAIGCLVILAAMEALVASLGPPEAATCVALIFVVLVNLTILVRVRDAAFTAAVWPVLAVTSIPALEQLLILSTPPLRWRRVHEYVLWSVPLSVGIAVLLATPVLSELLAPLAAVRPRLFRTPGGGLGLAGVSGQLLVALAGAALGIAAGLSAEGRLRPEGVLAAAGTSAWVGIVMAVFAGCAQELLYRAVIQPVASAVGGRVGVVVTSLVMAFAWLTWAGVAVAVPVIAASLLFGWAAHRWQALVGVIAGHGLFNLALALLWHRTLM